MLARRILFAAMAFHLVLAVTYAIKSSEPAFDFDRYYEIASLPGRPYVDHPAEHPIATVAVFKALAHLPGGRAGFGLGIVALNVVADAVIVGALVWGWGEAVAAAAAVMLILVLDLFFNRVDAWSAAAATLAAASWRRDSPRALGAALALGAGFKLWPLALAGTLFVPPPQGLDGPRFRRRALTAFVVIAVALAAATLLFAGWRGISQVVTFRGAAGWQIEGSVGSVMHLLGERPRFEGGSWRIGSASGAAFIAMFAVAAPLWLWSGWRGARTDRVGTGWLAGVTVLLLFSALFSAQYVIWIIPAAAIAWREGARRAAGLTAFAVFLTTVFWSAFPAVLGSRLPALSVVVSRNVVLLAVAALTFARLARPARL